MGLFEIYQAKAREHAEQDGGRRAIASVAEPLVATLMPGKNYVNPAEYMALCQYLLEGTNGKMDRALETGTFTMGRIEVSRSRFANDEWLSADEIALMCGKHRTYILRLAKKAKVKCKQRPGTTKPVKLYNFKEIMKLRGKLSA